MAHDSRVMIDSSTWSSWKADAAGAANVANLGGNGSFGLVTAVGIAVGLLVLPSGWRYSALLYAPALGFAARAVVRRLLGTSRFSRVAASMRAELVPQLIDEISDSKLHQLAMRGRTHFGEHLVFAMESRRRTELVAKVVPLGFDSDDIAWHTGF